jgi:hypothetical protein
MKGIVYGLLLGITLLLLGIALWSAEAIAGEDPFAEFISPVSNPTNFEDARIESDVRPLYIYHSINKNFLDVVRAAGLQPPGGNAQIVAVQIRLKLTDRLALIATKDGYVWVHPQHDIDNVVKYGNGFANVAAGLKYNFFRDVTLPALATAGLRYEAPSGEPQALQGSVFRNNNALDLDLHERGNGILNLFASGVWGDHNLHVLAYTGPRLALSGADSSFYDLSVHADYKVGSLYPLIELNWIHVLDGGSRLRPLENGLRALTKNPNLQINQEGSDFFNLGAPSAGGTDTATLALGWRWRILDNLDVLGQSGGVDWGAVGELPIGSGQSIFDWRVTTDLVFWVL